MFELYAYNFYVHIMASEKIKNLYNQTCGILSLYITCTRIQYGGLYIQYHMLHSCSISYV